ncbi:cell envelope integrity protein CreD [Parachitinimonas caeni]|uniref:Cell envelope integrity protein CreD n=1 Tax=Parachitinimonas caeni TaxID=3031301 RepID=A0ABT7DTM9_9NEIS|nr:cell envelope integrity protein CreD [Parachitinimonas caeni]MDK2122438.1 cell envelope integrity protein CreD [Parachitinimonas caeni]
MQKALVLKMLAIGVLALILLVPLSLVSGLVSERMAYRESAQQSLSLGEGGSQTVSGPVLVLPYREKRTVVDRNSNAEREEWIDKAHYLLPEKLSIGGPLNPEQRKRGIYRFLGYKADIALAGSYTVPNLASLARGAELEWGTPYLSLGIRDIRGIQQSPVLQWAGQSYAFMPGTRMRQFGSGIHAPLPALDPAGGNLAFQFNLLLNGMGSIEILPLGRDTEVALRSSWPHPSYYGAYLPDSSSPPPSADGFAARWRTSWFSTNARERFDECLEGHCEKLEEARFGVKLIEPVDVYLKTDRAVKYGFLFVFLTFGAFFLTEVLRRVAVHPVQYGLVGMSLALFFLLLLSLAEHMPFVLAYLVAASACVLQNSLYVRHVLRHRWGGVGFGALLTALYGMLYSLLQSEDQALLMGALLLFGLLTLVMVLTRHLDWYRINTDSGNEASSRDGLNEADLLPEMPKK